jgi:hypothetical protein
MDADEQEAAGETEDVMTTKTATTTAIETGTETEIGALATKE